MQFGTNKVLVAKIKVGKANLVLWDLSGESSMRGMWVNFLKDANGLIYVIDSSNHQSLKEAKETFCMDDLVDTNNIALLIDFQIDYLRRVL